MIKNDITSIPFDELYQEYTDFIAETKEKRLEEYSKYVATNNERLLAGLVSKLRERYEDSYGHLEDNAAAELPDDYFEADAREQLNLPDPKNVKLSSNDYLEIYADAVTEVVIPFINKYKTDIKFSWVLQQGMARLGGLTPAKNPGSGLYDGALTFKGLSEYDKGLAIYMRQKRALIVKGPDVRLYKEAMFNPLVPLFLASFKVYKNIPYSNWHRHPASLQDVVDADIGLAMFAKVPPVTPEERLHIQRVGLTIQTGVKAGRMQDPVSYYNLHHLDKDEWCTINGIDKLPRLAQIMLAQTWCAHPVNRNKYQVLDPIDWDNMPEPILVSKVLHEEATPKKRTRKVSEDAPVWGTW